MKKMSVDLKKVVDHSYDIFVEPDLLEKIPALLKKFNLKTRFAIITDSNVYHLYGKKLFKRMSHEGYKGEIIQFKAGEKQKNRKTINNIQNKMFEKKFARDSFVIALGGGVTGDIAGFVASTYNRGIPFVQIPTTLLSMVDSSIGGKTGIDTKYGKNLIGTFYQPKAVFIDTDVLDTLDKKELRNGYAEIIKHAIIADKNLFNFINKNFDKIISLDSTTIVDLITKNLKIKAEVVEKDELEQNLRRILNFGHTIGHAIEKLSKYKMSHGECVAIGMILESGISNLLNVLSESDLNKIHFCIKKFGLPVKLPKMNYDKIISATKSDKKAKSGKIFYALPEKIGEMHNINGEYGIPVEDSTVKTALYCIR